MSESFETIWDFAVPQVIEMCLEEVDDGTTRYYVKVGQEENEEKGYAWVDVNPGDARVDEDSLKKALTTEIIDGNIWPEIRTNINEETWGLDKEWNISGGTAIALRAN